MSEGTSLGRHLLADLHGIDPQRLCDQAFIESLLIKAALRAGATLLMSRFHQFGDTRGVTGVALLAESHISIHTWPEHGFAALDVFMCGTACPERAVAYIQAQLLPVRVDLHDISRGRVPLPAGVPG